MGALPFGAVPGLVLAGLVAFVFTLSGAVHVYANRQNRLEDRYPPLDDE
jgi:hypothetical protein